MNLLILFFLISLFLELLLYLFSLFRHLILKLKYINSRFHLTWMNQPWIDFFLYVITVFKFSSQVISNFNHIMEPTLNVNQLRNHIKSFFLFWWLLVFFRQIYWVLESSDKVIVWFNLIINWLHRFYFFDGLLFEAQLTSLLHTRSFTFSKTLSCFLLLEV